MPTSVIAAFAAFAVPTALGIAANTVAFAIVGAITATIVSAAFRPSVGGLENETGRQSTVRQAIGHWQWIYGRARVGGAITYIESTSDGSGSDNGFLHIVITLAGHEVEEIVTVYFDDEALVLDGSLANGGGFVSAGKYTNFVRIEKSLGNEAGQPFLELQTLSAGKWTDAHRQSGRAKLYVRLRWNPDLYPNGIPNITALVKGRKVYDPRSATTAWSDNAALCIADYIVNAEVGLGSDYATEINEAQLIAAANVCDEEVSLAAGGTEKRYTLNGAFDAAQSPREILPRLLTAMAGHARFIGGAWEIDPAVYKTPTITIGADDLRGALRIRPRVSKRDLCNRVKGLYISEESAWQPTDFPPVVNSTYLAEDQGEQIWHELDLPYTKSAATAQRIAKIELERTRQQITVEWPGKLGCYRLQPGDTVQVTLDRYGWSAKVFEVLASTLTFEESGGGVALGCDLVLRETAAAVYDWSSGEETTLDPAPDTNLPDPFVVGVPGNPDLVEALYETRDGRGVGVKAVVSWAASQDVFAQYYQLEYRPVGAAEWIVLPVTTGISVELADLAPGYYDFRVRALNTLGVASGYASSMSKEILGLGAPPADPVILGLQIAGGLAYLSLEPHSDLDVRRGGRWRVRFVHEAIAVSWDNAFSIGEPDTYMGDQTNLVLPLKPGTYLVRAEDSSGMQSVGYAFIETKQASVLDYVNVSTVQEDSTFSGTLQGTAIEGSTLTLGGTGVWDDAADVDAIVNVDFLGGAALEGTYLFAASHDFGAVSRRRLTSRIEGVVANEFDQLDDRGGELDDWLDFDGTAEIGGGSADAYVEMRETDDDPTGSPVWSEWKRLDAAEVEAWGVQYRAVLYTNDPAYRPEVSVLRVIADRLA